MARRTLLLAVAVAAVLAPTLVEARGYGRYGGVVNTPYGTMNMNSPEWRASGGNIFIYQELMQEKMMMQEQQMMMKQQQQYMQMMQKQAKQNKNSNLSSPTQTPSVSNVTSLAPTRKKKGHKTPRVAKSEKTIKSESKTKSEPTASTKAKTSDKTTKTKTDSDDE